MVRHLGTALPPQNCWPALAVTGDAQSDAGHPQAAPAAKALDHSWKYAQRPSMVFDSTWS